MAVAERVDSRLQLVFESGIDPVSGDMTYKTKSFNNVKVNATSDQLLAITDALVPLQQQTLFQIKRNDAEIITAE
ncbi:Protein of unknown function [Gracilibacillus ureilyticus]|uniref:DUF1659 domain-containing protein n=1 Tax=Gracilibacillus ureilyticus TaxID=531814 RepID=A0A1H9RB92_9BACI|nr:DUF1659 domain-containing protein [Gracilibacillus ureilyticus]SER70016.1 Protein of unknown function [Gracilibacillus ureilyticus]